MKEQPQRFKIATREWRVEKHTHPNDLVSTWVTLATSDDSFTADSRMKIEYYSDEIKLENFSPDFTGDAITFAKDILDNDEEFQEPEKWKVRHVGEFDRPVMGGFAGVPLPYFWKLWRRPLIAQNIRIEIYGDIITILGVPNPRLYFRYHEDDDPLMKMEFDCYLHWTNLYENIWKGGDTIMTWLHEHCHGPLYLFSDSDTIFGDLQDEISYYADFGE